MATIRPIRVFREPPGRPKRSADELATQLNLGPKSVAWLRAAGISSVEKIRELGVIESCRRVRAAGQPASVLLAYALEGALAGCHWNGLPLETKRGLRVEFARMKGEATSKRRPKTSSAG